MRAQWKLHVPGQRPDECKQDKREGHGHGVGECPERRRGRIGAGLLAFRLTMIVVRWRRVRIGAGDDRNPAMRERRHEPRRAEQPRAQQQRKQRGEQAAQG